MDGLIKEFHVDKLHVSIYKTRRQMGMAASAHYLQRLEAILAGQPAAGPYSQRRIRRMNSWKG